MAKIFVSITVFCLVLAATYVCADVIAKQAFSPTRFHNHNPGARNQPHYIYPNRSFYFVEDETSDIARRMVLFIESTPVD